MKRSEKIKLDTLILSDIHLGDDLSRGREILKILTTYDFKQLILNGDILDGLPFKRLHSEQWNVLSKFRQLSKNRQVVWVHGNHDADSEILSRLLGIKVRASFFWTSAGKKFLAVHGHQFDRFLNDNYLISQLAFAIYGWFRRRYPEGRVVRFIKKRSRTWRRNALEVAKGALRMARFKKADYVFCGHTHRIDEATKRGIKYYNTGCWVERPSAFATVSGSQVNLVKVE